MSTPETYYWMKTLSSGWERINRASYERMKSFGVPVAEGKFPPGAVDPIRAGLAKRGRPRKEAA